MCHGDDKKINVVPPIKNVGGSTRSSEIFFKIKLKKLNLHSPVGAHSVERPELTEGEVVHEEVEEGGGETTGKYSGEIVTVNLRHRILTYY